MKFGVRQIANVVFRATQNQKIGSREFQKGQPVFYLDTAKTSSVEGAATTVYATGGRGNTRLISWEGEKTLTFTVEDALLSPVSFAMLSGAGVVKGSEDEYVHFHQTTTTSASSDGKIDLTNALEPNERIDDTAPFFVMKIDDDGDLTGGLIKGDFSLDKDDDDNIKGKIITYSGDKNARDNFENFNNSENAYKFPFDLNKTHSASQEEIDKWESATSNRIANPSQNAVLGEPIPKKYLKTAAGLYYLPEEIFKVKNLDTKAETTLKLPIELRQPQFTAAELNAQGLDSANGYVVTNYTVKKTASASEISRWEENSGLKTSFYTQAIYDQYSGKSDENYHLYLYVKEIGSENSAGAGTQIALTKNLKNLIIRKYFGIDATSNDTTYSTARQAQEDSFEKAYKATVAEAAFKEITSTGTFMVDYYVIKPSATVTELQIDAENFAGYYYVEADTLFRRQIDGKDLPANLTFPNVKIQSNFTFSMASTGDPSTFTFTMDAFPGYTYFDNTKKVLCAIQIVDDKTTKTSTRDSVFSHKAKPPVVDISKNDSSPDVFDENESTWEND